MVKATTTINNKLGLHARASAKLTKLAGSFPCEVWMSKGERRITSKSDMGVMMGVDNAWAKNAILAVGNYGEIFAANIGESTPIGLARGLNELWSKGGLQYAPPMR